MENIYYLLLFSLVCWYFIYLRKISEIARIHAVKYCKSESLQFIAIARRSSKLKFSKAEGVFWLSLFELEFSGDGESNHQGLIRLKGNKLDAIDLPAYRVN